ncbi:MAG: undecaprenyl-diphosphate phosphatase [Candidatus Omnitrophota bacterium]
MTVVKNMSFLHAIIAGIIQGLTEFLPISSSGHLVILHKYFGYNGSYILFDIFLHIGTFFSVLVYFRHDIINLFKSKHVWLLYIFVASLVTFVLGFLFSGMLEKVFGNLKLVGVMLLITASFLFIADYFLEKQNAPKYKPKRLTVFKALVIGLVQALAILPGISRSGSTISAGLVFGMEKRAAVRFSFFLSLPAILGALVFKLKDLSSFSGIGVNVFFGTLVSFSVGFLAISLLLKIVEKARLKIFAFYCLILSILVLIF